MINSLIFIRSLYNSHDGLLNMRFKLDPQSAFQVEENPLSDRVVLAKIKPSGKLMSENSFLKDRLHRNLQEISICYLHC